MASTPEKENITPAMTDGDASERKRSDSDGPLRKGSTSSGGESKSVFFGICINFVMIVRCIDV